MGIETPELVRWKEISYQEALAIATDYNNGHGNDPGKYDPSNPGGSK